MSVATRSEVAALTIQLAAARRHAAILPIASLTARVAALETTIVTILHTAFAV